MTGCSGFVDGLNEARDVGLVEGDGVLTNVSDLEQGDCINDAQVTDDGANIMPVVNCSVVHDSEIYRLVDMNSDDGFPGDEVMAGLADDECSGAFEGFVGVPYEQSTLALSYYYPTRNIWIDGNRNVLCIVFSLDENGERTTTVGSLKHSAL
jgi:hypothetical protein